MAIFTDGMKFKDVTTAEQPSEAIEKGKILINTDTGRMYLDTVSSTTRIDLTPSDTALSTTSTNPIQNQALTNSIINTLSGAIAVTVDSIPCGTKPVKELATTYPVTLPITGWTAETGGYYSPNVTLSGITANSKPHFSVVTTGYPTSAQETSNSYLNRGYVVCSTNTLVFHSPTVPTVELTIEVRL